MTTDFRRATTAWCRPSMNPMSSNRNNNNPADYHARAPWSQASDELVDDFERNLNLMQVDVKHPWTEGSIEMAVKERERENASKYEFNNHLFTPEPMSADRQKQLDSYQYNPPFLCGDNYTDDKKKDPKKMFMDKRANTTRSPWSYGSVPAEPVHRKIHARPSTALWEVPRGDQGGNEAMAMSGDPILDGLRMQLKQRGASSIAGLSKKFRIMDDDGSGTLNFEEFRKGMKECEVADLSDRAIRHLFLYFDRDDSGVISYDEFLVGIRGVMNDRRKAMVKLAFTVLDKDRSGRIDMLDIKGVYNASSHPDVVTGRKTEEEILKEFLEAFERGNRSNSDNQQMVRGDGIVTLDEFQEYYASISASIDNDDYFELMIRNAWHISGGSNAMCANTTNRRVLVTNRDGTQSVKEVENDMGIRANDTRAMILKLQQQAGKDADIAGINLNGAEGLNNMMENAYAGANATYNAYQARSQTNTGNIQSARGRAPSNHNIINNQQNMDRPGVAARSAGGGSQSSGVVKPVPLTQMLSGQAVGVPASRGRR